MSAIPMHHYSSPWFQENIWDVSDRAGNRALDIWNSISPDQTYEEQFKAKADKRKREFNQYEKKRIQNEVIRDTQNAYDYRPQGVNKQSPANYTTGAEAYGSYGSPRSPSRSSSPVQVASTSDMEKYSDIITTARKNIQDNKVKGVKVSGELASPTEFQNMNGRTAHPYSGYPGQNIRRLEYDQANYKLGMGSPEMQRRIQNDNRLKAERGELRLGTDQFGYKDMSPAAFKHMEIERMGGGNTPLTQSQQYHADMKGKALPIRDNRSFTPSVDDIQRQKFAANQSQLINDMGKFTNLRSSNNQTSDSQIANNGNINNAANNFRSSTPARKGNGFF